MGGWEVVCALCTGERAVHSTAMFRKQQVFDFRRQQKIHGVHKQVGFGGFFEPQNKTCHTLFRAGFYIILPSICLLQVLYLIASKSIEPHNTMQHGMQTLVNQHKKNISTHN